MKIQVGGLSEGLHRYSFTVTPGELGLTAEFEGQVAVQTELEKTSREILLKANVLAAASWECDRCVVPFRGQVESGFQTYYVPEGTDIARFDPADVQVIPGGSNVIDISDDVRQSILLSVPLKRVCREDCKGLCPHCGKNLNETRCGCRDTIADGRWDKLKELQNKINDDVR